MAVCTASVSWDMELVVDSSGDNNFFLFIIDRIDKEIITGEVRDEDENRTPLTGTCTPVLNMPEVSRMSFDFNVIGSTGSVVRVFLAGMGYQPNRVDLKPVFTGRFVAFPPIAGATSGLPSTTLIDVGETGTGNGTQT